MVFEILCIIFLPLNIILAFWTYFDAINRGIAEKSGSKVASWVVFVFVIPLLGILFYILTRPKGKIQTCANCRKKVLNTLPKCPHCDTAARSKPVYRPPPPSQAVPPSQRQAPPPQKKELKCPHCNGEIQEVWKSCPHCGKPNRQGVKFCASCGKAIAAAAPSPAPHPTPEPAAPPKRRRSDSFRVCSHHHSGRHCGYRRCHTVRKSDRSSL